VGNKRYEQDPAQWVMLDPKVAWKTRNYAGTHHGRDNAHRQIETHYRVVLEGSSTGQERSVVCGINHELILADILALGIPVLHEPAAHPIKIAEQMVKALQAHHSERKRQAVRDERTGF